MIRVTTASRLHFGLFALPVRGVSHWPNAEGQPQIPVRSFGGVGLMIDQPGVQVTVRPAASWSATGPAAERALAFGQRFVSLLPEFHGGFEITIERCSPEHAGLGTGTQLALAVARAIALATGHGDWDAVELARRVGRGLRSSLGIHGFQHGGFLVEGGKNTEEVLAPLLIHHPFPDDWRILLIARRGLPPTHGLEEREAFARLEQRKLDLCGTDALCRLTLLGMLPALVEHDLPTFAEALHDFNRRVGEMFAPWQGGVYSHSWTAELIGWLRQLGIRGVGQSSWGPAVFAIDHGDVLQRLREQVVAKGHAESSEVLLCSAVNQGARHE
jgi:beta-RFAP synthase